MPQSQETGIKEEYRQGRLYRKRKHNQQRCFTTKQYY